MQQWKFASLIMLSWIFLPLMFLWFVFLSSFFFELLVLYCYIKNKIVCSIVIDIVICEVKLFKILNEMDSA